MTPLDRAVEALRSGKLPVSLNMDAYRVYLGGKTIYVSGMELWTRDDQGLRELLIEKAEIA